MGNVTVMERLRALQNTPETAPAERQAVLQALASEPLAAPELLVLDRLVQQAQEAAPEAWPELRLAVLADSTVEHLLPALRIGVCRAGFRAAIYLSGYGQYQQDVLESGLGVLCA